MISEEDYIEINKLKVEPGAQLNLNNYPTNYEGKRLNKSQQGNYLKQVVSTSPRFKKSSTRKINTVCSLSCRRWTQREKTVQ
jgi:hypothetical protein